MVSIHTGRIGIYPVCQLNLKKDVKRRSTSFGTKLGTELALKLFEFWAFHLPIGLTGLGSGTREKKKKRLLGPPVSHMVTLIFHRGLLFIIYPVTIVLAIYLGTPGLA